jgi:glycosyltransferase involved in cell wall biosynthesis
LCQREDVDLFHVHNRPSFRFIAMCKALGCLPRKPVVFLDQFGDIEIGDHLPAQFQWIFRWVKPYCVGVHPSLTQAAQRSGIPPEMATVVSNAVAFSPFEEGTSVQAEAIRGNPIQGPTGVIVANVRPQKDYGTLLRALAQIRDQSWHLLAIGSLSDQVYSQKCLQLAAALGLVDRVSFLGSRLDIPALLKAADFAVLSSRSESGPLVLLEYAAAGLPFVSTRVGLIGKALAELGVPEFVPPGDVEALAAALRRLLQLSPEERRARGQQTHDLAASRFDIRNVMPQWYHVYERALEGGPL